MTGISENQIQYIKRVAEARKCSKKKQEECASFLGIARNTYANYESVTAEPQRPMPQKYIAKFCEYLDINEKWLLTGQGVMSSNKVTGGADFIQVESAWDQLGDEERKELLNFSRDLLSMQQRKDKLKDND